MPHYVEIEPATKLTFKSSSSTEALSAQIQLSNVSDSNVGFKIKTTQPQSYIVVPNHGIIEKGEKQIIEIQLMRIQEVADSHNDKFLVQIIKCSLAPDQKEMLNNLISHTDKKDIQLQKLSVHRNGSSPQRLMARNSIGPGVLERSLDTSSYAGAAGRLTSELPMQKSDDTSGLESALDAHPFTNIKANLVGHQDNSKASDYTNLAAQHTLLKQEYQDLKKQYQKLRDNQAFYERNNKAWGSDEDEDKEQQKTRGEYSLMHLLITAFISLLMGIFLMTL